VFPGKRTAALAAAAWLVLAALGCARSNPGPRAASALPVTTEAGSIDLAGLRQRLGEEQGRVVVVNYWATWCIPCREEFPDLIEFQRRYHDRGVVFLSISLDSPKERDTEVKKFLVEQQPPFPVFIKTGADDPETFINAIDPQWTGELPATFIYDRRGRRAASLFGPQTVDTLAAKLKPLL
jgi:thiol-disulfide isomerase/thioredoxin